MRRVLDSNVSVKWLLPEDPSDKARVLRDEFARGLHELLSPDIFTKESDLNPLQDGFYGPSTSNRTPWASGRSQP
jgi:hypothetical protein